MAISFSLLAGGAALVFAFACVAALFQWRAKRRQRQGRNPFAEDARREPAPYVADHGQRDAVLKQGFSTSKVPNDLDAVVIGSGIGGLTCALLLARAGKRVMVLEQHDQAGGCCHTFYNKGFEFDTGIHYIGEMRTLTLARFLIDQLTAGQLIWSDMDDAFDIVLLGEGKADEVERFPIRSGRQGFVDSLAEKFPSEREAIQRYVDKVSLARDSLLQFAAPMKMLPAPIAWLLRRFGPIHKLTPFFKLSGQTLKEVLDDLTKDDKLKAVLAYCWGNYGCPPSEASFAMHGTVVSHYLNGPSYPRGGPSEIPFHIVQEIEAAGGTVLVRAKVTKILTNTLDEVCGVRVRKGMSAPFDIPVRTVISSAGLFNTYEHLLATEVANRKPSIGKQLNSVGYSTTCFTLFIGLRGDKAELNLPAASYWALLSVNHDKDTSNYHRLDATEASQTVPPVLFISFPSAKDPTWDERMPGKSTALVIAPALYDWFAQWEDERVMKRSDDYKELKKAFEEMIWQRTVELLPQLKGRVEYMDLGTPVTNRHYLASPGGEMYSANHDCKRFSLEVFPSLRPETSVPGLFLSGQDVLTCGFMGAMVGGVLAAGAVLGRPNLYGDMAALRARLTKVDGEKQKLV